MREHNKEVVFRCSSGVKKSIKWAADALHVSITELIIRGLQMYVSEMLIDKSRNREEILTWNEKMSRAEQDIEEEEIVLSDLEEE
jgi:hypothetical protein